MYETAGRNKAGGGGAQSPHRSSEAPRLAEMRISASPQKHRIRTNSSNRQGVLSAPQVTLGDSQKDHGSGPYLLLYRWEVAEKTPLGSGLSLGTSTVPGTQGAEAVTSFRSQPTGVCLSIPRAEPRGLPRSRLTRCPLCGAWHPEASSLVLAGLRSLCFLAERFRTRRLLNLPRPRARWVLALFGSKWSPLPSFWRHSEAHLSGPLASSEPLFPVQVT